MTCTYSGEVSGRGSDSASQQRLTPAQFSHPHSIARFGNTGQLVVLQPDGAGSDALNTTLTLCDLKDLLAHSKELKQDLNLIENFPGPLTRLVLVFALHADK